MVKYIWGGIGVVESVSRSAGSGVYRRKWGMGRQVLKRLKAGLAGLVRWGS